MNKIIIEDMEYIYRSKILNWERFRNKTVLITGAYGMLASYLTFFLISLNERNPSYNVHIIAVCRNRQKVLQRFGDYLNNPYFSVVEGDICGKLEFPWKIDYIIHAASPASSQYYGVNPTGVLLPNVIGTYNMLELARINRVEGFLYFSSAEIYGKLNKKSIFENDSGYLDVLDVRNCYAESKRMGENMCKCWQHQYSVSAKVVRPAHTYGPTMDLFNDRRVFAEFVANAVKGEDIVMKSDGSAKRNFCYIADAALGYFTVLLDGASGEAYNVSNEKENISIAELAKLVAGLFPEKNMKVIMEERQKNTDYIENTNKIQPIFNTEKLRGLGWDCKFSVSDGFRRTIQSFLS